jgi:hypothetical protein
MYTVGGTSDVTDPLEHARPHTWGLQGPGALLDNSPASGLIEDIEAGVLWGNAWCVARYM